MKTTVIRVSNVMEKDLLANLQKKIDEFLTTPIEGKLPTVRFICQSEYTPEKMGAIRGFTSADPHVTYTILWE
jgi:hypothetical protein